MDFCTIELDMMIIENNNVQPNFIANANREQA